MNTCTARIGAMRSTLSGDTNARPILAGDIASALTDRPKVATGSRAISLGIEMVLAFVSPDKVDLIAPIRRCSAVPSVRSLGSQYVFRSRSSVARRQIALMSIYLPATRACDGRRWETCCRRGLQSCTSLSHAGQFDPFSCGPRWCSASTLNRRERGRSVSVQNNAANVFYALIYMVLFAIPIVA